MKKSFKKKFNLGVVLLAACTTVVLLNTHQRVDGTWQISFSQAVAQSGGDEGGGGGGSESPVQIYHYDLNTVTDGVPNFAQGRAILYPNAAGLAGIAIVTTASYTFRSYLYTKSGDGSQVGFNGTGYNIGYSASYTVSGLSVGTIDILDGRVETI